MTTEAKARKPRRRAVGEALPDTPDPIEIAMMAVASGKPLPDAARTVLEKHARLIDCQADLAQAQVSELRLRNVGERVRAALWAVLALAAAAILALAISIVARAARSDALIVQAFDVPPSLQARGMTGKVVATQVLDKLAELQVKSESVRPAASYGTDWGDELKIDIPNTGTSFDQVWKLLRGWLGRETRISGEVFDTSQGLALTARSGSDPARRFVSATGDLDQLVTDAAELIYKSTQPYRFAVYLVEDPARLDESEQVLRRLVRDPSAVERKWAFNGLSVLLRGGRGDPLAGIAMAKEALKLDPHLLPSLYNIGLGYEALGWSQEMLDAFAKASLVSSGDYDPIAMQGNFCAQQGRSGVVTRDPASMETAAECLAASPSSFADLAAPLKAEAAILRRQPPDLGAVLSNGGPASKLIEAELRLRHELVGGDAAEIAAAFDSYRKVNEAQLQTVPVPFRRSALNMRRVNVWPLEAEALAGLGRVAEAQALIDRTPKRCYTCARVRGLVAEAAGDPAAAARWYAEAVRQGPRIAPAYQDWGRLLMKERRFREAATKFETASKLAPNWADPLKSQADLLAGRGLRDQARRAYDQAIKLAPQWPELREARKRVLD